MERLCSPADYLPAVHGVKDVSSSCAACVSGSAGEDDNARGSIS